MIDFMQLMLAVVDEYKYTSRIIYIWVGLDGVKDSWAIDSRRETFSDPPTFVFGGTRFAACEPEEH